MKVAIEKSNIRGKVIVPSSKSMTLRALMCAALSMGKSEILYPLVSEDTNAATDVLGKIGIGVIRELEPLFNTGVEYSTQITYWLNHSRSII